MYIYVEAVDKSARHLCACYIRPQWSWWRPQRSSFPLPIVDGGSTTSTIPSEPLHLVRGGWKDRKSPWFSLCLDWNTSGQSAFLHRNGPRPYSGVTADPCLQAGTAEKKKNWQISNFCPHHATIRFVFDMPNPYFCFAVDEQKGAKTFWIKKFRFLVAVFFSDYTTSVRSPWISRTTWWRATSNQRSKTKAERHFILADTVKGQWSLTCDRAERREKRYNFHQFFIIIIIIIFLPPNNNNEKKSERGPKSKGFERIKKKESIEREST